ncbi:hypothetical protein CS8_095330 [Cupriavidus sp. 8B]
MVGWQMANRAFDYGAKFRAVRRDFLRRRTDFLGSKQIEAGRAVEPSVVPAAASYIVEAVLGLKKDEEVGATQIVHVGAGEMASSTQKRIK